ncbi:MAG: hypothetical protein MJ177_06480 [Clostridia bacterium]|nr:hypothetical protein [Clostridia bacterium]
MVTVSADFNKIIGKIKPVHGFNNSARETNYGPVLESFSALKPPFARLHDTGYHGNAHYVDIPCIFPDFCADPDDEKSYDFALTDYYIKPLVENGIKVMYRLGVTIEHEPKKHNIFAPSDPQKWASVCEHIVRHYNDGWADGFHFDIDYWEVWNEPDGLNPECEPYGCPNWIGTAQQYYELYVCTAKKIKELHPGVKVGGYSSCYILGRFENGCWTAGDASYFTNFLKYVKVKNAPLDFFTYHGYLGKQYLEKIKIESCFVRDTLDRCGFTNTECINAEWNINICDIETENRRTQYYINYRSEKGASHAAASLYEMQRCSIDSAMYYDSQLWTEYGGLYRVPSLEPSKTYYAFKQFGELYGQKNECESHGGKFVYTCAAAGEKKLLCIANISENAEEIRLEINGTQGLNVVIRSLSKNIDYEQTYCGKLPDRITLEGYSFITVEFEK